jgi:hypothetical protein
MSDPVGLLRQSQHAPRFLRGGIYPQRVLNKPPFLLSRRGCLCSVTKPADEKKPAMWPVLADCEISEPQASVTEAKLDPHRVCVPKNSRLCREAFVKSKQTKVGVHFCLNFLVFDDFRLAISGDGW